MHQIRWIVTNQKTGNVHVVPHPVDGRERGYLYAILRNAI